MRTAVLENDDAHARAEDIRAEIADVNAKTQQIIEDYVRAWAKAMGSLRGRWTSVDERASVVEFVERWNAQTGISRGRILEWLGIGASKFFYWKRQIADAEAGQSASERLAAQ